jgi:hypothetical protein
LSTTGTQIGQEKEGKKLNSNKNILEFPVIVFSQGVARGSKNQDDLNQCSLYALKKNYFKNMAIIDNPQFNNEVQHLGPAEPGGYPKFHETILQASVVSRS